MGNLNVVGITDVSQDMPSSFKGELSKEVSTHIIPPVQVNCYSCVGNSRWDTCHFHNAKCHHCHQKGHAKYVCHGNSKTCTKKATKGSAPPVTINTVADSNEIPAHELNPDTYTTTFGTHVETWASKKAYATEILQGALWAIEVDSGFQFTLTSEEMYNSQWLKNHPPTVLWKAKL